MSPPTIAVLGLGEAGRLYAQGLGAAGARVRAYDAAPTVRQSGVRQVHSAAEAASTADVVLSLVGADAAADVAADALAAVRPTAVYADLNTATPDLKRRIATLAADRGVAMADVAVLAPVPRAGHCTELLASGTGARLLADRLRPLQVPIVAIDAEAGEAARLKLLRSVFMKGLAAVAIEGLTAARAAGAEGWLRDQIVHELGPDGAALLDRLVDGTHRHARRREHEMRDALAMLEASRQPADMTRATVTWLHRLSTP